MKESAENYLFGKGLRLQTEQDSLFEELLLLKEMNRGLAAEIELLQSDFAALLDEKDQLENASRRVEVTALKKLTVPARHILVIGAKQTLNEAFVSLINSTAVFDFDLTTTTSFSTGLKLLSSIRFDLIVLVCPPHITPVQEFLTKLAAGGYSVPVVLVETNSGRRQSEPAPYPYPYIEAVVTAPFKKEELATVLKNSFKRIWQNIELSQERIQRANSRLKRTEANLKASHARLE